MIEYPTNQKGAHYEIAGIDFVITIVENTL
jgi:hypothetical protein